mgnify:CR=1 FL=1
MTQRAHDPAQHLRVGLGLSVLLAGCSSVRQPEDRFHNLPYPFTSQFECDGLPSARDTSGLVTVTVVEAPSWPTGNANLQHWANGQPQLTTIALGRPATLNRDARVDSVRAWSADSDTVRGVVPHRAGCRTRVRVVLTTRSTRD